MMKLSNEMHLVSIFFFSLLSMTQLLSSAATYCRMSEYPGRALVAISEPAYLIQISSTVHTEKDCSQLCCDSAGECNAVSFYKTSDRDLCVMLKCQPFKNCTWKKVDGFYAAYVTQEDTPETNVEVITTLLEPTAISTTPPPTTTTTTTTTTTIAPTTTKEIKMYVEPEWNLVPDDTESWNKQDPIPTTKFFLELVETSPASSLSIQTTSPLWIDYKSESEGGLDSFESESGLDSFESESGLDSSESESSNIGSDSKPKIIEIDPVLTDLPPTISGASDRNGFAPFESPYILIGFFSVLSLAVILLVVVLRKLWITRRGKPQYRPLRDYDVHVEPPGSSAALLP